MSTVQPSFPARKAAPAHEIFTAVPGAGMEEEKQMFTVSQAILKLDGVGPVDNRPSPD